MDSLKEDATVDVPTTMTTTQLLLIWTLLGFLLLWMIIFTLLALRPEKKKHTKLNDITVTAGRLPIPSAPPMLHVITGQHVSVKPPAPQLAERHASVQETLQAPMK